MVKRVIIYFVVAFLPSILSPSFTLAEFVYVERVIDGDTFVTTDGTVIRIKDIDTPETHHPTKGKEPGGDAATQLAMFYLQGKHVGLNGKARDKYGRRLATVKLPDGQNYANIVKSHGFDKNSKIGFSNANSSKYNKIGRSSWSKSMDLEYSPSSDMTWVDGYYRKDGTWVSGHWRKKHSTSSSKWYSPYSNKSYFIPSPSYSSGQVKVRGY